MKTAPLFKELLECNKKIIICQGGGDAAKTVSILQCITIKLIQNPRRLATVTAQDTPNIKGGVLRTFENYVISDPEIAKLIIDHNKTERTYKFFNGSVIEFKAFEDELDARGSERDYLFMNEANSQPYQMFWQLNRKTRVQTFIDYNPTSRFWVHENLLSNSIEYHDKVIRYIVDHRHNPFLTEDEHQAYENISDADMFKVYARGQTGKIKGLIFAHFKPIKEIPVDCTRTIWGLDYGYTNDPTALVKVGCKPKQRFMKECCYRTGMSAEEIKQCAILNGFKNGDLIFSEHDVNMVAQLRRLNLPVHPARKGPGSVAAGISKMKEYECFYTSESVNFKVELDTWKWTTSQDITTGREVMTNVPVDGYDHLCQAGIYAVYSDSFRNIN